MILVCQMEHTHLKMAWIQHQIKQNDGFFTYPPPLSASSISLPPPPPYASSFHKDSTPSSSSGTKISPAVLFIIVIVAVLFFISGVLHLLVRFLIKHPSTSSQSNRFPDLSGPDALQRQLQQLFHLHDSGLDQAFIDALPVFQYREIVGLKEPFDCAVCLCEFTEKDKLRLLPMCSHAFHINCIDTWLLSNSSCPLCRGTLFAPGFSIENSMFDFDDSREDEGCIIANAPSKKPVEIQETAETVADKGVLPVRLGKFKKLNDGSNETVGGETGSSNLDARRCYSMGSYQYVLGASELRVALCGGQAGTDQNGNVATDVDSEAKKITSMTKKESFSVSKIWLWSRKGKFSSSSDDPQLGMPTSLHLDLPWIHRAQEK